MNTRLLQAAISVLNVLIICPTVSSAQELKTIQLLQPQMDSGRPLMQVLRDRRSSRTFGAERLPTQVLSNMLWAAFGVNRPDSGGRTAPSAMNWQEIDIYVAMADGLYLYDAKSHALKQVLGEDIRAVTGLQPYVQEAPVNLVYVADFSKMGKMTDEDKVFFSAANTGFIGQNVYLFCASEGLATVVRGAIDKPALAKVMGLQPNQKIILAQSVGYPRK
jgi:SagB-type dehydrogenase family enzyme